MSSELASGRTGRVAVLGAGYIAAFHIRALRALSGIEVVAVADVGPGKAQSLAARFGVPQAFESTAAMLEATRPDVVHILLPPARHAEAAVQCLEAGCHVFVEKPFTVNSREAQAIRRTAVGCSRRAGVNHNAIFHPAFQKLVAHVREWGLGELQHVTAFVNVPLRQLDAGQHAHWMFQEPGNIILEQAPHPLSQIQFLLGDIENVSVLPAGVRTLNTGAPFFETWQTSMICRRGTAQCFLSFGKEYLDFWIHAVGQDGSALVDMRRNTIVVGRKTRFMEPVDQLLHSVLNGMSLASQGVGGFADYALGFLKLKPAADPFFLGMKASIGEFYQALRDGTEPPHDLEQGAAVVQACEAMIAAGCNSRPQERNATAEIA